MKVVDVILKRVLSDWVSDSVQINPETDLRSDLNIGSSDLEIIRQRVELIFDIRIPKETFKRTKTYNELCEYVLSIFNQEKLLKEVNKGS